MPSDAPSGPSVPVDGPASAPATGTGARNWWAIGAVVVGVACLFTNDYFVASIVAILLARRASTEARTTGTGARLATAGYVLGVIGICIAAFAPLLLQTIRG